MLTYDLQNYRYIKNKWVMVHDNWLPDTNYLTHTSRGIGSIFHGFRLKFRFLSMRYNFPRIVKVPIRGKL